MAEKVKSQDPATYHLQKTHFSLRDTHRLEVKGGKETLHANKDRNIKKAGVPTSTYQSTSHRKVKFFNQLIISSQQNQ